MKKSMILLLFFICNLAMAQEKLTLEDVIFGEYLNGPELTWEDCRGRVCLFFCWCIT